jgi:hypothetical protein
MLAVCFCVLFGLAAIAADDLNINTEGGRQLLRAVKSIRQINYLNITAHTANPNNIRASASPHQVFESDQS